MGHFRVAGSLGPDESFQTNSGGRSGEGPGPAGYDAGVTSNDGSLARGGPGFPATAWSVIRGAQDEDERARARALDRLVSVYWRPVYWSLRLDWRAAPEDAKDLTQEFFTSFLERQEYAALDESRGRFRGWVKVTLRHFMLDERRRRETRRGAFERRIVPLDDLGAVEADPPASDAGPDARFERELMRAILRQARDDLRRQCARAEKTEQFRWFDEFHLAADGDARPSYQELAERCGASTHAVKNGLAELRARYRKLVLSYVRDGVRDDEELAAEVREVFRA